MVSFLNDTIFYRWLRSAVYLVVYVCLLGFWFFGLPGTTEAVWFDSSWDYRVKVEVNPTKVGTTTATTNFPVYNDCGGFPTTFWTLSSSTGADIRVVESDELTETPFEMVSFSTSSQKCELHFLADSLSTTSSSTFYIYYGNPAAQTYAVGATYGRNAVWASYNHVWHLGDAVDSKGAAANGTDTGVTYSAGSVGNEAVFGGSQQIQVASGVVDNANTTSFSITGWVKTAVAGVWLLAHQNNTSFRSQKDVAILSGDLTFQINPTNTGTDQLVAEQASEVYDDNTRRFISVTYDGSKNTTGVRFYLNGVSYATTSITNNMTSASPTSIPLFLGSRGGAGGYLTGSMDEWRIKPERLSDSYILTEYNNQSSTSTFFYIGAQEAETAPEATTTPSTSITGGGALSGGTILR